MYGAFDGMFVGKPCNESPGLCIRVDEAFGLVIPTWPPEAEARLVGIGEDGRRSWSRSRGLQPRRVKVRYAKCQGAIVRLSLVAAAHKA